MRVLILPDSRRCGGRFSGKHRRWNAPRCPCDVARCYLRLFDWRRFPWPDVTKDLDYRAVQNGAVSCRVTPHQAWGRKKAKSRSYDKRRDKFAGAQDVRKPAQHPMLPGRTTPQ